MNPLRLTEPPFVRQLLRNHAEIGRESLACLLYLLDALKLLRSQGAATREDELATTAGNLQRRPNLLAHDANDSSRQGQAEAWRDWLAYAEEMYLISPLTHDTTWRSPLLVPRDLTTALTPWLDSPNPPSSSLHAQHQALASTCEAVISYLQSRHDIIEPFSGAADDSEAGSAEDAVYKLFDSMLICNASPDVALQQSIRDTLADARHAPTASHVNTFRSLLSSVLEHHYNVARFGPCPDEKGNISYAVNTLDHDAILIYFAPNLEEDEADDFADGEDSPIVPGSGSLAAVRAAHLQMQRRDAKLKAFFGEAVNSRRFSDSHNLQHRLTQSESLAMTGMPDSPIGRRRAWSNGSSAPSTAQISPRRHVRTDSMQEEGSLLHRSSTSHTFTSASHAYTPSVLSQSSSRPLMARVAEAPKYTEKAPAPISTVPTNAPTPQEADSQPFSDCLALVHQMPPTANTLSSDQRRHLVKRSRKLQAMLGATLDESAAQYTLVDKVPRRTNISDPPPVSPTLLTHLHHSRRSSYPPPSPTSPFRRASVGSLRSPSPLPPKMSSMSRTSSTEAGMTSEMTSPETGLQTPDDYDARQPWGHAIYGLGVDIEKEKEDRRRRVAKLQRFLGEKIPVDLVSSTSGTTTMGPKHKRAPSRLGTALKTAGTRLGLRGRSTTAEDAVEEGEERSSDEVQRSMPVRAKAKVTGMRQASVAGPLSSEMTIASIRRARKLEQVFGELPPTDMFQPPVARTSTEPEDESDDEIDVAEDIRRGHHASVSTRRDSVKALLHLHEHDPAALDDLAQALGDDGEADDEEEDEEEEGDEKPMARLSGYTATTTKRDSALSGLSSSEGYSAFEPEPISPFSAGSSEGKRMSQRISMSSDGHRHYARAAKLASIFGTTKGAVLRQVLEDLEADLDDSEASDDERREMREGLSRLRAEACS